GKQFVDRADEFREIDAEGGIGDALLQKRQHQQPRHDEGAIADAVDLADARADGGAEDDEIERGRDDRRDDALQLGALPARHFIAVDRFHRMEIHDRSLTRLTKMSSSELWSVCRSRKRSPAAPTSPSSEVMPVRSPCVSYV